MTRGILHRGHLWLRLLAVVVATAVLPLFGGVAAASGVSPNHPVSASGGTLHVLALGPDIYGSNDVFSYLYTKASGNGTWEVEVINDPIIMPPAQNAHACEKAGLMIRTSLAPDSPMFDLVQTACQGGPATFFRETKGGNVQGTTKGNMTFGPQTQWPAQKLPVWIKLQRNGNKLISSISYDGRTWPYTQTVTSKVSLPSTYYVGIAANAHSNTQFSQFDFSGIQGFTPTNYEAIGTKNAAPKSVTVPAAVLRATVAAAPAASAPSARLPKTGGGAVPMAAGAAMLGLGLALLRRRPRASNARG